VVRAVAVIGGKLWCKRQPDVSERRREDKSGHTLSAKFRTPRQFIASITEEVGGESSLK
jgi:hypothetical protein